MKNILLIIAVSAALLSCSKTVQQSFVRDQRIENIIFNPAEVTKILPGNLSIRIRPIDATRMDSISYFAANTDGAYNSEISLLSKISNESEYSSFNTRNKKFDYSKIYKFIDLLESRGTITKSVAAQLKYKVYFEDKTGLNGLEEDRGRKYPFTYNPYRINGKYLSVFEMLIENNSSKIEYIHVDSIMVITGYNQIIPLKIDYFEKISDNKSESIENVKNIYRFNIPNQITVAPSTKIIKYFSIPSLDEANPQLQVKIVRRNSITDYGYSVSKKISSVKVKLNQYRFNDSYYRGDIRKEFIVLSSEQGTWSLKKHEYYTSENNQIISAYSISIDPTYKRFRFGIIENIKAGDFRKSGGQVNLKYDKWRDI